MKHLLLLITLSLSFYAKGQLLEDFSGGSIDSRYPWKGDLDKFRINEQGELQLFAAKNTADARIYLNASIPLYNNEWSCRIKNDRASSSANYCSVYLFSKRSDPAYPGYALLVRVGHRSKRISLCRQYDGKSPEVLIAGMPVEDGAFEVDFKVISDDKGSVSLYCRNAAEKEYISYGSAGLTEPDGSGSFMLYAKYTSNYSRNKYFDNVYIRQYERQAGDVGQREKPLSVDKIEEVSATSIRVYFNRPVDENTSYFTFSLSGIESGVDVFSANEDPLIYQLEWERPLMKGESYTLSWKEIYDDEGNECKGSHTFASVMGNAGGESSVPDISYKKGDVIVSEVMADPNGLSLLPQTEYVELHNTTSSPVSLKGWAFLYNDKETLLEARSIPSNGYALLYRKGRDIEIGGGGLAMPLALFPAQLANEGKAVGLKSPAGDVIDRIVYPRAKAGLSWERDGDEWALSADARGGTPGSENSSQPSGLPEKNPVNPGDIVFNEIMPDPFTGGSEYVELYNRSDKELAVSSLSVAGRKTDGSLSSRCDLSGISRPLKPRGYMALTKDKAGVTAFYTIEEDENIREVKLPALANTSSTLVLLQTDGGTVIDEVTYSNKWHSASVKDRKGVSLERINPDNPSNDAANWTSASSTGGSGTPGYRNSQYLNEKEEGLTHIEEPVYSKEKGEYHIAYHLNRAGYNCRAWVYNLSGVRIAEIAGNELTGTNGVLIWNGVAANGSRLYPGLYILYLELYHPGGDVIRLKKPFLVYGN